MTIARFAARIVTRLALQNRTMAEGRVQDSTIANLEAALSDAPLPVAIVYTDDSDFKPERRALWGGSGHTTIVIIFGIAGAYKVTVTNADGEEEEQTEFSFPPADAALEMGLDFMERQIQCAIMDPDNPWGLLWHRVISNVTKYTSRRGGSTKEGVRFAARQIILECETVEDPVMGAEPEGVWLDLITALQAEAKPDIAGLADPLRGMIRGRDLPNWKRQMAELGISLSTARKIGLGVLTDGSQAPISRVTIDGMGMTSTAEVGDDQA